MKCYIKINGIEYEGELCIGRFEGPSDDKWYWQFHPYTKEIGIMKSGLGWKKTENCLWQAERVGFKKVED